LDLYRIQLEDKLNWQETIEPVALDCLIPPMVIQMLVENAIKHGIGLSLKPGFINLSIVLQASYLVLKMENSIADQVAPSESGQGIGIHNIERRLKLIYGDAAAFSIDVGIESAKIILSVPIEY
jgi:two-component system, LytTR family, sensor kinase